MGMKFYCDECEKYIPAEEYGYGHDCELDPDTGTEDDNFEYPEEDE